MLFDVNLDRKIFTCLKNKQQLVLTVNSRKLNVFIFYLANTQSYSWWLFISAISTHLELVLCILRDQAIDLHQLFFLKFISSSGVFAHFCCNKSLTWALHKSITKCGVSLKSNHKYKYDLLFLLNIVAYVI